MAPRDEGGGFIREDCRSGYGDRWPNESLACNWYGKSPIAVARMMRLQQVDEGVAPTPLLNPQGRRFLGTGFPCSSSGNCARVAAQADSGCSQPVSVGDPRQRLKLGFVRTLKPLTHRCGRILGVCISRPTFLSASGLAFQRDCLGQGLPVNGAQTELWVFA